jgi:2-C-methyl-D-erythritol 4-phosphate cytidylyltransferase
MKVAMLVVGAGRGERLGDSLPKAFVPLAGQTLLERSLRIMSATDGVHEVIPVIAQADLPRYAALGLEGLPKLRPACAGGAERHDSVAAGLSAVSNDVEIVGVHDAARCLVTREEIERVIAAAIETGAALLAVPSTNTLKRVRDGDVVETVDRTEMWAAQTPQVFRIQLFREAIAKAASAGFVGTDDAQLVEHLGAPVRIVRGTERNIKITHPDDLATAESWLSADRAD